VSACRSSGSLRRAGRGSAAAPAAAGTAAGFSSYDVDSGWERLHPSR
jgi:hypothetical protein